MAGPTDREVFVLSDDKIEVFNSKKSISWSNDNRASLCCAEKLLVLNLVVNPNLSYKKGVFKAVVEELPHVSTLEKFSFPAGLLDVKASAEHLTEYERQKLLSDPSLIEEFVYPNTTLNTFCRAVCSPTCLSMERSQLLIAAVTCNHRVVIYGEVDGTWCLLLDCSILIKELAVSHLEFPVTLGRSMDFSAYTDLVYSMSTVELAWSSLFNIESPQPFVLLFTGCRNGDIHIWKTRLPLESVGDFIFQCTNKYWSEVTALSWQSTGSLTGLLSVGYMDGSVRILEITSTTEFECLVQVAEVFTDRQIDYLSILDMSWARIDQDSLALLSCKQYHLFVYSVLGQDVRFVRHYHLDISLPLTSISMSGYQGVASSQDGSVFRLVCSKEEDEDLSVSMTKVEMTSLPYSDQVPWMCQGVAISSSSGLCLSGHRLNQNYSFFGVKKKNLNRQVVLLSAPHQLDTGRVTEFCSGGPVSPQMTMVGLRLHIQHMYRSEQSLEDISNLIRVLRRKNSLLSLQIVRDMTLYIQHIIDSKGGVNEIIGLTQTLESDTDLSEAILVKHVESCLRKAVSRTPSNDVVMLRALLNWVTADPARKAAFSDSLDLVKLTSACKKVGSTTCAICAADLAITDSQLMSQCSNGHSFKLCCLTLLPCQTPSTRKCECCGNLAVSLSSLSGVDLVAVKSLCTLCGGYLRDTGLV